MLYMLYVHTNTLRYIYILDVANIRHFGFGSSGVTIDRKVIISRLAATALPVCQALVLKQVRHKDTRDHVHVSLSAPAWKFDIPAIVHRTQDTLW
jgi:hypothetical protein